MNSSFKRTGITSAALIAIGLLATQGARAQSAPASGDKEATPKEVQTLDRVEVTSGKRPQSQSDVAGTVTAISGADIEKHGSADIEDLLKLTPGVQLDSL